MLNEVGFDLWADGYDESVRQTDAENQYPFAGYSGMMNAIDSTVMQDMHARVLDVGVGTGVLTKKLYDAGCDITGIDFSSEMLAAARYKMPNATLLQWDFAKGIPSAIEKQSYDFVISTYALHHLAGEEQEALIGSLLGLLKPQGRLLIGDVCFPTDDALLRCREFSGDAWDDEENYIVVSKLQARRMDWAITFQAFSFCCGLMEITRRL